MLFSFCPACGKSLVSRMDGPHARRLCPSCGFIQYRNPTVGVAVILLKEDEILLVKRKGSYAGQWCIPCGHVEWDEDVRQAAIREMEEETGLVVRLESVFDVLSNFHDSAHHTVGVWFLGKAVSGELCPGSDASDARFFSFDALPKELAFPTDRLVLEKLMIRPGL